MSGAGGPPDRLPDGRPNWLAMTRADFDTDVPGTLFDYAPEADQVAGEILAELEDRE